MDRGWGWRVLAEMSVRALRSGHALIALLVRLAGRAVVKVASADDVGRLPVLAARWAEGREFLEGFGQEYRDQAVERIEEAVVQVVVAVRAEERRGAELRSDFR